MPSELAITAADVEAAHRRIGEVVVRTPAVASEPLRQATGIEVACKLESVQPTGSFKVRGAASRILALDPVTAARGVVTASTGNHGRAVAHVAATAGVPATVCVSDNVPAGKVAALRALGCEVVVGGASQTEALVTAADMVEDRGMTLVHPFDDPEVIAGQGTIGREILEQRPATTTVVVPLSGGGLIAGIAVAVKAARPDVNVVGVSMERAAVMAASLDAGHPVDLAEEPTLADSLQGGIGLTNRHTFAIVRELVDDVVLLTEQDIWDGMRFAYEQHRWLLEGGGAVGIAALLAGHLDDTIGRDGHVTVVCSGANAEDAHVEALALHRPHPVDGARR